jgi:DNA-damage-inducible protein D
MKKEQINELLVRFEKACYLFQDIECWSARDLQESSVIPIGAIF